MARRRGPRSHPDVYLWFYRQVKEVQHRERCSQTDALYHVSQILSKEHSEYRSTEALWGWFYKGKRIAESNPEIVPAPPRPPTPKRKKMGRPTQPDAVRDVVICCLVGDALRAGYSKQEAFRIVARDGCSMGLTTTAVRAVYNKLQSHLQK